MDKTKSGEEVAAALDGVTRIDLVITDLRRSGTLDRGDVGVRARRHDAMMPIIYAIGFSQDDEQRVPGSVLPAKPYRSLDRSTPIIVIQALLAQLRVLCEPAAGRDTTGYGS